MAPRTFYEAQCIAPDGSTRWRERGGNIVVDTGLNDLVDKYFKGSAYTATHYVGLKSTGAIAAADTMASHAGWTEFTGYGSTARPTLTLGTVGSTGSANNSASKASYTFTSSGNIAGAFVTTGSSNGGSSGTLYGAADFASARAVEISDVLNVTVTVSAIST